MAFATTDRSATPAELRSAVERIFVVQTAWRRLKDRESERTRRVIEGGREDGVAIVEQITHGCSGTNTSRSCCVVQDAVGCAVELTFRMRRDPISITTSV
jgi:hypothetical protein